MIEPLQPDWQTVTALLIVLAAIVVFVRTLFRSAIGASSGCQSGCSKCPASRHSDSSGLTATKLVQLDAPDRKR